VHPTHLLFVGSISDVDYCIRVRPSAQQPASHHSQVSQWLQLQLEAIEVMMVIYLRTRDHHNEVNNSAHTPTSFDPFSIKNDFVCLFECYCYYY
jgi:hypothetical protein